jgi:hypothetical protein
VIGNRLGGVADVRQRRRDCLDVFAASTRQGDVTRRAVEEANAKAVLETGNGIAIAVGDTFRSRAAARKLPRLAMATTASSSINPSCTLSRFSGYAIAVYLDYRDDQSPLWCSHTQ